MKKSLCHSLILLSLLTGFANISDAQNIARYSATTKTITRPGFYKIMLGPEIIGRATRSLSDIRILDHDNKQVPYLLRTDLPVVTENNFLELKIISTRKEADKLTHVVLENPTAKKISELILVVKNNDASRSVTISGSDDQTQWFVIRENIALTNLPSPDTDTYIQSLEFPVSSYRYLKIIINGKDLLPINIVKAGIYEDVLRSGRYVRNPLPAISQLDSAKRSYVHIRFDQPYQTDQLALKLSGPKYFQRRLTIAEKNNEIYMPAFDMKSGDEYRFTTGMKSNEIEIVIENEDNPPLKIDSVYSFQLSKYLLAFLDSAQAYKITFGDSTLAAPRYDIGYFRDSLANTVSVLETGEITAGAVNAPATKKESSSNTIVMWTIIVAVLLLLLYLTMRMTKEINEKNRTGV